MSLTAPRVALLGGAALLVAGIGAGSAALASVPSATTGLVNACYSTSTGALRVIDTQLGNQCHAGENQLKWPGGTGPQVFQGDVKNESVVLGPQADPTHVVDTPPLTAGTYVVSYDVGVVLGPSDNVVCAAAPASQPHGNDGLFGGAGNGSSTSGTGPDGVYGAATETETITVGAGERVSVWCNSGQGDRGTYVGNAVVTAQRAGSVVVDHQ